MNKNNYFKNFMLCSFMLLSSFSYASMITTGIGQGADSYIRGGPSANINYGSFESLGIKNAGTSGMHVARKIYLRFDISTFSAPVSDATLRLIYEQAGNDTVDNTFFVYGLNDGVNENWVENTITWSSGAPANITSSPGGLTSDATLIGSFIVPQGSITGTGFSFSNSGLVDFLNNDTQGLATLILTAGFASDDGARFSSKEGTLGFAPPTLEITAVPLPSSIILFLSGIMFLYKKRAY